MEDLLEELKKLDEIDLLELLDITSEDIVNAFQRKIEKRRTRLEEKVFGGTQELEDEEASSSEIE